MKELRYTLLTDGSSDRVFIPILNWILHNELPNCSIEWEWADLRTRRNIQRRTLIDRIRATIDLYSCDLLFIHRDAEREPHQVRKDEIIQAVKQVTNQLTDMPPAICVVPVRMQEAWLLIDEQAIRNASGNPNGKQKINLPHGCISIFWHWDFLADGQKPVPTSGGAHILCRDTLLRVR